jgi:hypothetical protein
MAYYFGNVNPGKGGGSAFQRGKGGRLKDTTQGREARAAFRNRQSNQRADRRSERMGGGRAR